MKCLECGTEMRTAVENHRYDESGLSGVVLVGVEVSRCPHCGNREVTIPAVEKLHRAIALCLVKKTSTLAPEEVRFLRKSLGWSNADFARHLGVRPETVSQYQNEGISPLADRLLRLLVVQSTPIADYSVDLLEHIADVGDPLKLRLRPAGHDWQLAEAA